MAFDKTNFYKQDLNQTAPKRLRGEYLDWGLNATVLEVEIDASVTAEAPLYAGDRVAIVAESTGKPKVKAATAEDKFVGYILYNPKWTKVSGGAIVSILIDGGVIQAVTTEAIEAGKEVYYKAADGSVTATAEGGRMGFAMKKVAAVEDGTLIPVFVKPGEAAAAAA